MDSSLFYLRKAIDSPDQPEIAPGASGYFSAPESTLDPSLFSGNRVKTEVRRWILDKLYGFWKSRYASARSWSTVWIAGSGASYQWSADRGNGDLDILIGIDFPGFFAANPRYRGEAGTDIASQINGEFKELLWPATAATVFGSKTFEVTFYVNPQSSDIRDINPYAAYDLSDDSWTIRPPHLPVDPSTLYPAEFFTAASDEKRQAMALVARYEQLRRKVQAEQEGSPGWINSMSAINIVSSQAAALFDDIHLGRRQAFGEGGSGYGDYYNFRWQSHKQDGTVAALSKLAAIVREAKNESSQAFYGQKVMTTDEALTRAALWNSRDRN